MVKFAEASERWDVNGRGYEVGAANVVMPLQGQTNANTADRAIR